ncbi:MAG: DUF885 domain-containing protein [Bacteroidota bacterium]
MAAANPLRLTFLLLILFASSCRQDSKSSVKKFTPEEVTAESAKANAFFDRCFDEMVDMDPELQTYLGIKQDYGQWTDRSDSFQVKRNELARRQLEELKKTVEFDKLDDQARLSYRLFEHDAQELFDAFPWRYHNYPVNQMDGVQSGIPAFLINMHRIDSVGDAEAYVQRLKGIGPLMDQVLDGLRVRDSLGIIPPRFVYPMVMNDCRNVISGYPFSGSGKCPLYEDFSKKLSALKGIDGSKIARLQGEASRALVEVVKPAYERLMAYLKEQEKRAKDDDGAWKFPKGNEFYRHALEKTTTTNMTPEQVFDTGLREVKRIHDEMRKIMEQVKWRDHNISAFFSYLRDDPKFYFPDTREGKENYRLLATGIIDTMRQHLDELFVTKPKATIVVKPVEPFREQSAGGAFYEDPSEDGKRPGTYYINLYNMKDQPIYQAEALAYHEGIPGHHMQIAIAQELKGVPKFRRHGGNVAYVEGWALYSELVPKEIGFYKDPYSDFGRLSNEVFRAARLVVDVGIHYKKWTRAQAFEYFLKNTPNPEGDCRKEIDRYIVWPGQATGYKIGMLRILELRAMAQRELGPKFDLREFHDVILTNGPLPLNILGEQVRVWIEQKKSEQ